MSTAEAASIQRCERNMWTRAACGVSRSSDVTDRTETDSNRGRTLAAGVMPGACDSHAGA